MIQEIGVFILFGAALFYLFRTFFASAPSGADSNACGTACKGCGAVDFKAIEKQMAAKKEPSKAKADVYS